MGEIIAQGKRQEKRKVLGIIFARFYSVLGRKIKTAAEERNAEGHQKDAPLPFRFASLRLAA